jgi:nitrite reductase/ring-hydroxylating ferredoxin subunit
MHFSRFDVTTGKLLSGPKPETGDAARMFGRCPGDVQKAMGQMFSRLAENQSLIKTYDQPVYEVKVDSDTLRIRI